MSEKPVVITKLVTGGNGAAHESKDEIVALIEAINTLVGTSGGVIMELIRSAANMPLLAVLIGLWANSLAYKLKLIDSNTNVAAFTLVCAAGGVTLTGEIATAINNLIDILPFAPGVTPQGLLVPGAKVLNYGGADLGDALAAKYSGD